MGRSTEPMCSPLLVRPFARMLRSELGLPRELASQAEVIEAGARRVPMVQLQRLVIELVAMTSRT